MSTCARQLVRRTAWVLLGCASLACSAEPDPADDLEIVVESVSAEATLVADERGLVWGSGLLTVWNDGEDKHNVLTCANFEHQIDVTLQEIHYFDCSKTVGIGAYDRTTSTVRSVVSGYDARAIRVLGDDLYFVTSQGLQRVPLAGGEVELVTQQSLVESQLVGYTMKGSLLEVSGDRLLLADPSAHPEPPALMSLAPDGTSQQIANGWLVASNESLAFVVLDELDPACGGKGSCLASVPSTGGTPTYVMDGAHARGARPHGQWLYYVQRSPDPEFAEVYRVPIAGGEPERVVGDRKRLRSLNVTDEAVFWVESVDGWTGRIMKLAH